MEVDAVVAHAARLGPPRAWAESSVYDSLALAVIDAVWSIGVRAGGVANVIGRYRALRGDADTPADLAAYIDELGGPEAFADVRRNRQRTSTVNGILKAEAVRLEARMLAEEGVTGPDGLTDRVRARWIEVRGQGSGISWDALLILTGHEHVKPDRMIRRFVAEALGVKDVPAARAHALVLAAAERLGVSARALDYAIWRYQSGS
jgi:hypothetical protein